MAVKGGLGRGLGSKGKGIDSIISPSAKPMKKVTTDTMKKTSSKTTENNEKVSKINKKTPNSQSSLESEIKMEAHPIIEKERQLEMQKAETYVKVSDIEPNRQQPRKNFDEDALLELADSIRQYGVLSPILVQKNGEYYEIIAGERRWRAAKLAGLKEVPVIVREYTKQEVMEIALIENIQRENLNPIEEAVAFKRLLEEFGLKQDELANRVSKSRAAVTNSMRLLKLDERVQKMLIDEMLSSGHARALLGIEDAQAQYLLALRAFDEKLSVRDIEKLVRNIGKEKKNPTKQESNTTLNFIYRDLEERMTGVIGTKVTIHERNNKKGKIEITYHSNEELERLTDLLLSLHNQ